MSHDLCVGALSHHLGVSESAVSQHLQLLKKHGLVKGEKRGYWTHYAVDREALSKIGDSLKELAGQKAADGGCCFKVLESNPDHCKNRREKV